MNMNRHMLKSIKNIEYHSELQSYSMLCYFHEVEEPKFWAIPVNHFDPISMYMSNLEVKGENSESDLIINFPSEEETAVDKGILDFDSLYDNDEFRKKQERKNVELLKTAKVDKTCSQ